MASRSLIARLLKESAETAKKSFSLSDLSPTARLTLFDFSDEGSAANWCVFSDSRYGGASSASLACVSEALPQEARNEEPGGQGSSFSFLRFAGQLRTKSVNGTAAAMSIQGTPGTTVHASALESASIAAKNQISSESPNPSAGTSAQVGGSLLQSSLLRRSGFAYMRTTEGDPAVRFDLDEYDSLVFHARGDGMPLVASLRTESWACGPGEPPEHVWQTAIAIPPGPEWFEVRVPFTSFLRTWKGRVASEQPEMNRLGIVGLGFAASVVDAPGLHPTRGEGPFTLDLLKVMAAREPSVAD